MLVNCTSVGLRDEDAPFKSLPLQADTLGVGSYVADMVYRPGGTQLLVEAHGGGGRTVVTGWRSWSRKAQPRLSAGPA